MTKSVASCVAGILMAGLACADETVLDITPKNDLDSLATVSAQTLPQSAESQRILSDRQIGNILLARTNAVVLSRENGIPLVCQVGMDVLNIMQIDATRETYTIDYYVWVSWKDARLAFDTDEFHVDRIEIPWEEVVKNGSLWSPELEFANSVDIKTTAQSLRMEADGKCTVTLRQIGTFRSTGDRQSFKKFPFDRHDLELTLESFRWDTESLIFEFEEEQAEGNQEKIGELETMSWKIVDINSFTSEKSYMGDPAPFSRAVTAITIQREPGYYFWKVCLPLFVLVLIAIAAPWVSHHELGARLAITLTTLVAIATYGTIVGMELPKLSYLTLLDKWMLSGFVISGLCALETVCVAFLSKRNNATHIQVDRHTRWLMPTVYCGITAWLLFL